jgi:hypothetical protein
VHQSMASDSPDGQKPFNLPAHLLIARRDML